MGLPAGSRWQCTCRPTRRCPSRMPGSVVRGPVRFFNIRRERPVSAGALPVCGWRATHLKPLVFDHVFPKHSVTFQRSVPLRLAWGGGWASSCVLSSLSVHLLCTGPRNWGRTCPHEQSSGDLCLKLGQILEQQGLPVPCVCEPLLLSAGLGYHVLSVTARPWIGRGFTAHLLPLQTRAAQRRLSALLLQVSGGPGGHRPRGGRTQARGAAGTRRPRWWRRCPGLRRGRRV